MAAHPVSIRSPVARPRAAAIYPGSISQTCGRGRLRGVRGDVLDGGGHGILDDDLISAMVGDAVIKQLCRVRVQFLAVLIGDLGGHLLESPGGLGVQIRAGDLDGFGHVGFGDSLGEFAAWRSGSNIRRSADGPAHVRSRAE